jgi:hypothetical protein
MSTPDQIAIFAKLVSFYINPIKVRRRDYPMLSVP